MSFCPLYFCFSKQMAGCSHVTEDARTVSVRADQFVRSHPQEAHRVSDMHCENLWRQGLWHGESLTAAAAVPSSAQQAAQPQSHRLFHVNLHAALRYAIV